MLVKGSIDTIYELLIVVVGILILFLVLFRIGNWLEGIKPKEKKSKVKKEIVKETIKKVTKEEESNSTKLYSESSSNNIDSNNQSNYGGEKIYIESQNQDNYLYDRFVVSPTKEDSPNKNKIFNGFLSDDEIHDIKDRKIEIHVNEVQELSNASNKDYLYNRIYQMANENLEKKEKLLKEFDSLPREIKLILIENIMQKM